MLMLYPAIALLHNEASGRWHPILFSEAPFPGAPDAAAPVRLRSRGHHTLGFETREAAIAGAHELKGQVEPMPAMFLEADIAWDGAEIPAMHLLCSRDAEGNLSLAG